MPHIQLNRTQLQSLARRLVAEAGGQVAAAQKLGITQQTVCSALGNDNTRYIGTLIRIVEGLSGRKVEVMYIVEGSGE